MANSFSDLKLIDRQIKKGAQSSPQPVLAITRFDLSIFAFKVRAVKSAYSQAVRCGPFPGRHTRKR